ncbi:hypothetical protein B0H63DRAFT_461773 [Podospora didyma]|uniref:HIT-type domain-containing protein n=1 Tax=Podospora didyma TaxID=330526 RepID=A0AAE0P7I9_9PEZI|nr:hypothetical protein B0H63DRAFT_461773 [Podospora didyma]
MNNFGVIEVAGAKRTNAPGWAYVPDTGPAPTVLQPANRKRAARNQAKPTSSDISARQDTKIRKELEALDRDAPKDVNIPIPPKTGKAQTKYTPNVRKILQSQKTFTNHLDDYQALFALAETNPTAAAALNLIQSKPTPTHTPAATTARNSPAPPPPPPAPASNTTSKRSAAAAKRAAAREAKEAAEAEAAAAAAREAEAQAAAEAEEAAAEAEAEAEAEANAKKIDNDDDVEMADAPPDQTSATSTPERDSKEKSISPKGPQSYPPDGTILPAYQKPPPAAHPSDNDVLLVSPVPPFPTDDELRALMTAPPLSYLAARAEWGDAERQYPARTFCDVCGYWGRVRCMKCGSRVCALDCLDMHRQECVTRYGL